MEVIIKNLINSSGEIRPYAVAKVDLDKGIKVKAGDYSFNTDNEVFQANQSTCVWCDWKVIGEIAKGVEVNEGEKLDIYFKCAEREKCNYPFCGNSCKGNDGFYVAGREDRGY